MICPNCKAVQAIGNRCSDCGTEWTAAQAQTQENERARRYRARLALVVTICLGAWAVYQFGAPVWEILTSKLTWTIAFGVVIGGWVLQRLVRS